MPPQTPVSTPEKPGSLAVKAASFVDGVNFPGYGMTSSVNSERAEHRGVRMELASLGLLVTHDDGRRIVIPHSNLKWVVLA